MLSTDLNSYAHSGQSKQTLYKKRWLDFLTIKCQDELFLILLTWSLHYIPYKVSSKNWQTLKCQCTFADTHAKDRIDGKTALWINEKKAVRSIPFHQIMFLSDMSTMLDSYVPRKNHLCYLSSSLFIRCWLTETDVKLKRKTSTRRCSIVLCTMNFAGLVSLKIHRCGVSQLNHQLVRSAVAQCNQSRVRHMDSWQDARRCQPV